jgi:dTDP-4-amino-4,6-dideoxygalactose transaminase
VSVTDDAFIPLFDLQIEEEDVEAVAATLRSGWLTMGPRIAQLEEAFAGQLGCEHAVAVSSCTAALHLAYLAAGIGPGDEVVVPSYTFAATAAAVLYCGGTPVFADVLGEHDLSIDPDHVASLITPRTKAVACVHFAGYAAPVRALRELCDAHGLALIEDVAHAPSATPVGSSRKLGTWGAAGCFSFFSNKVLPSGEGGLLATGDEAVAARARSLRSHAMTSLTWERHRGHAESYDIVDLGFNYRLDEPRAALLLSRLPRLDDEIAARRRLTLRYRELLAGVPGVVVPYRDDEVLTSSCYVMPVLVDADRRDDLRIALRERHGVQTSLFYPPVHRFTAYRERFPDVRLPRTEAIAAREVTIPLFAHMTEAQQARVVAALSAELAGA